MTTKNSGEHPQIPEVLVEKTAIVRIKGYLGKFPSMSKLKIDNGKILDIEYINTYKMEGFPYEPIFTFRYNLLDGIYEQSYFGNFRAETYSYFAVIDGKTRRLKTKTNKIQNLIKYYERLKNIEK
jgi:hypothetical protein